eukprot:763175-Hanusia_phi.AAC.1
MPEVVIEDVSRLEALLLQHVGDLQPFCPVIGVKDFRVSPKLRTLPSPSGPLPPFFPPHYYSSDHHPTSRNDFAFLTDISPQISHIPEIFEAGGEDFGLAIFTSV